MKQFSLAVVAVTGTLMMSNTWALDAFSIDKIGQQPTFKALSEDMAAALSYKAITPAEPLGTVGFDLGLEVTGTQLASIDQWGAVIGNTDLSVLPLPKLHVHKGLPFDIDVGLVYSMIPTVDISYLGGSVKYSPLGGNVALPSVSISLAYTTLMGVDDYSLSNTSLELSVSKGFLMFTPYAGIGNVWSSASSDYQVAGVNVFKDESLSQFKWFVGFNLNMGLMNIALETDQTGDSMSYSGKLGFRF